MGYWAKTIYIDSQQAPRWALEDGRDSLQQIAQFNLANVASCNTRIAQALLEPIHRV